MFNPLPLRLCCLAIMAPALTSEAATRAREKLTGAPTSPGTPLMNGRDHQISMSNSTKSNRDPGIQPRSISTPKTSQVVTISKDLQKKLEESGHLRTDGKTTEQAKGRSMGSLASISTLSDLYRHKQLEVFGSTSIIQTQQLNKLIYRSTSAPSPDTNTSSAKWSVPTTSNGTVTITTTKNLPATTLVKSKLSTSNSSGTTPTNMPSCSTSTTSILNTAQNKAPLTSCIQPPVPNGQKPAISQGQTAMTNGLSVTLKSSASKTPLIPVNSSIVSSKAETSKINNVTKKINSTVVHSAPQLLDTVARRQKKLQTRAERLLRRLRRLQSRQTISHTKQQLNQFVEHQRQVLPGYGKSSNMDFQTELLHSKSMSTAALVELVHKMQSTQSTLRQQLATAQDLEQPTRLGEDRCADLERVSGHLRCNMSHLQNALDSDATESSSGGESCDELDYDDDWDGKVSRPPIQCRAEWHWSRDRAAVAARWTWLQAQVSDLEYRIRQQYDIYKQIRANKGNVVLGEPPPPIDFLAKLNADRTSHKLSPLEEKIASLQSKNDASPANVSMLLSNVDKQSSLLTDQLGSLYTPHQSPVSGTSSTSNSTIATPKTPSLLNGFVDSVGRAVDSTDQPPLHGGFDMKYPPLDHTFQAARCRPAKSYRKRKLLRTVGLHHLNRKAARLSTVQCHCYPPVSSCAMCGGRYNNAIHMDATTMPLSERVALVDVSYHSVLSFSQDVSLSTNFESMLKTGEWQQKPLPKTYKMLQPCRKKLKLKEVTHARKYQRRLKKNTSATILSSTKIRNKYEQKQLTRNLVNSPVKTVSSNDKKLSRAEIRLRKQKMKESLRHMKNEGISVLGDSQLSSETSWKDGFRKKRGENAYDINNIVIPYSIAASTRVEKLQYKEIITPKWREIAAKVVDAENVNVAAVPKSPLPTEPTLSLEGINSHWHKVDEIKDLPSEPADLDDTEIENLTDDAFQQRHIICEISEKKRFSTALPSSSHKRGRGAQRTDSTASIVNTEPSSPDIMPLDSPRAPTPTNMMVQSTPLTPSAEELDDIVRRTIQEATRRRSSSVSSSKSNRSRTASHSDDRYCIVEEERPVIAPWTKRSFPLTDEEEERLMHCLPAPTTSTSTLPRPERISAKVIAEEMVTPTNLHGTGDHSDTSEDLVEDPDDPEWTVISERQQQSKQPHLVLKLAKR